MNRIIAYSIFLFLWLPIGLSAQNESEKSPFFEYKYDDDKGTVSLIVTELDKEFLYMNALAAGVGSNDLGLDRGKIGNTRIVKFVKQGNTLLLQQPNLKYRAESNNEKEKIAVREAFASSVLFAFEILSKDGSSYVIDLTPFLLQDANGIAQELKRKKEGTYKVDKKRSVISKEGLHSFPKNTEFESILTFGGEATGKYLKTVTPSSNSVTITQHQSFIALPDDEYKPRVYHPYSGFNNILYYDYATSIHEPMAKRYIARHRLEKKKPGSAPSEAVDPIVYYVDSGCPEPIKSALIEGASWWNQAYTAAGFINAFKVKELPPDAHPLDVRYNVIQWVHRSTRGWSYGASVVDPRTGEIIKGHVSLGSLRVRQDFMIAQGILSPYTDTNDNTPMTEMALARLRQLSAHEVGHTIGLAHNFAASCNNRASVMDYPHPLIKLDQGNIDLSDAYDDKIGVWDKRTIMYGYSQFEDGVEESTELENILKGTKELGLLYMSDSDARPMGGAHPKAHLWDSGNDPIEELKRLMILRKHTLEKFGENTIPNGTPYSELEKVLVPAYLMHRYQAEGVAKIIGGVDYNYAVKGFDEPQNTPVSIAVQYQATQELLNTLSHQELAIPQSAIDKILPSAKGFGRSRESFGSDLNMIFDPLHAAEAYTNFVLTLMLHPERLARINQQEEITLEEYLSSISSRIFTDAGAKKGYETQLTLIPKKVLVIHLIKLVSNKKINKQVAAMALLQLKEVQSKYLSKSQTEQTQKANNMYLEMLIDNMYEADMTVLPGLADMPPGSPIGCGR
jgi:hypothetical protein